MYSTETQLRIANEFTRLGDSCYLDTAGAALYGNSQIQAVAQDLQENVYGNPHSLSLSSRLSTDSIDQIRYRILELFHTSADDYAVVFTSGATAALKLVAHSFDWTGAKTPTSDQSYSGSPGTFAYLQDNHTSVLGMRETAAEGGAAVCPLTHSDAFDTFSLSSVPPANSQAEQLSGNSLFVYPAQCNFSGLKYPLSWVSQVHTGVLDSASQQPKRSKWFCLLDAASFVATNMLDLSVIQPDFVCISFYKIFGYPTGLGALLVRTSAAHVLQPSYFGGGTVLVSLSGERFHVPRPGISERLEDGTLPFLAVVSVRHGLDVLGSLPGGVAGVGAHTHALAQRLHHALLKLHHASGSPVAQLYCDTDYEDATTQGGIVTFNLLRPSGEHVGFSEVLNMASLHGIHLRTGCFCNPGACQRLLGLTIQDVREHFAAGHVCGDSQDLVAGRPTGAVRVSFGYMSSELDVERLLGMIHTCFVEQPAWIKVPAWYPDFVKQYHTKFPSAVHVAESMLEVEKEGRGDVLEGVELRDQKERTMEGGSMVEQREDIREGDQVVETSVEEQRDNKTEMKGRNMGGDEVQGESEQPDTMKLTHLFVYPVKSCGAFRARRWPLDARGLMYDRQWMIVTPAGVALTQKQEPRLCLVRPSVDLTRSLLRLNFPGEPTCEDVTLRELSSISQRHYDLCSSKVCGDQVPVVDCGDAVAQWLSTALDRPGLRLVRQLPSDRRILSLSNKGQFLLINAASVSWLSNRMGPDPDCFQETLLGRFRANLVVDSFQPFEENQWTSLRIGDVQFTVEGPCTRCQMVCVDQSTGRRSREPLRTLAASSHGKMKFGVYLTHQSDRDCCLEEGRSIILLGDVPEEA